MLNFTISWTELFAAEGSDDFKLEMRVIQKGGQPFIMLPRAPGMAPRVCHYIGPDQICQGSQRIWAQPY